MYNQNELEPYMTSCHLCELESQNRNGSIFPVNKTLFTSGRALHEGKWAEHSSSNIIKLHKPMHGVSRAQTTRYDYYFEELHLPDTFIQSDLQCIQVIHVFCQYMCSLGIEPTTFALLTQCSNHWATGIHYCGVQFYCENYTLKNKGPYWHLWFQEETLTSMEPFRWSKGS